MGMNMAFDVLEILSEEYLWQQTKNWYMKYNRQKLLKI